MIYRVGPESAGASPGPVCYGRGGTRATVTDADVVLGIINPERFLGGRMKLDRAASEEAIREQVAKPLGMSVDAAAAGIRRIVDSQMADLVRQVTIGRGHDPEELRALCLRGRRSDALRGLRQGARHTAHRRADDLDGALGLWRAGLRYALLRRAQPRTAGRRERRRIVRADHRGGVPHARGAVRERAGDGRVRRRGPRLRAIPRDALSHADPRDPGAGARRTRRPRLGRGSGGSLRTRRRGGLTVRVPASARPASKS